MANTDPEHWFLPPERITPFRQPAYTAGNTVRILVDGAPYMADLADVLAEMQGGDYLLLSGWRVTPTQNLHGEGDPGPTFVAVITGLMAAGVLVRALVWKIPAHFVHRHGQENASFVDSLNEEADPEVAAMLDDLLPKKGVPSHHQKVIVLSAQGQHYAYLGGIDIATDRWDTTAHDEPDGRTREGFDAWHDIQCAIQGPAVAQVWDNFAERWNAMAHHALATSGGGIAATELDPGVRPNPDDLPSGGDHYVQLLRNLAADNVYEFAPDGEQTVRHAYRQAIDRAEQYIYIEDQYLWPCPFLDQLKNAVGRGVKLILVLAKTYDTAVLDAVHNLMQRRFLDELRAVNAENVFAFHLRLPDVTKKIQVHTKAMIIDDRFAAVGTANVNHRSHTCDGEIHVGIVDRDTMPRRPEGPDTDRVGRLPRAFRKMLWHEHLGTPVADPDPLEEASQALLAFPGVRVVGGEAKPATAVPELTLEPFAAGTGTARHLERIAWSPDGTRLAGTSADGQAWVVDLAPPGLRFATPLGAAATDLAWHPLDVGELAVACDDGTVRVLDSASGAERLRIQAHQGPVTGLTWSPDGASLATTGHDRRVGVWARADGAQRWQQQLDGDVLAARWSPDGALVAAYFASFLGAFRGTYVSLWDATTGQQRVPIGLEPLTLLAEPRGLAWAPVSAGRRLAATYTEPPAIWHPTQGTGIVIFDPDVPSASKLQIGYVDVTALAWRPQGDLLASNTPGAAAVVWQLLPPTVAGRLQPVATFLPRADAPGHDAHATDVAWRPDGLRLATATDAGFIWIWDTTLFHIHHVSLHEVPLPRGALLFSEGLMNPDLPVPID